MPRKTAADKARNSARYYKGQIKEAWKNYEQKKAEIDAPLTEAMRWLYAALAQRARENPAAADALYRQTTENLAKFAEGIQGVVIEEFEKKTKAK
jgi:type VI protein secretion system component VasF